MIIDQLIKYYEKKPKKLFLTDGTGALLSAVLLGIVLVEFESFFGIPRRTLYFLALLPCIFAVYDFYFFVKKRQRVERSLKGIALMNLLYSLLSVSLAIYHHKALTYFGWLYIVLEVTIVITLVNLEYRVANECSSNKII